MNAVIDPGASVAPANVVWVQLNTRIVTQNLHFRSGQEETALKSVVDVFKITRELMAANPAANLFLELAGPMLECIRPYTARWHAMVDGTERFRNPALRRQFRAELKDLQEKLAPIADQLAVMSGHAPASRKKSPARPRPDLGAEVVMGIECPFKARAQPDRPDPDPDKPDELFVELEQARKEINKAERAHIAQRRNRNTEAPAEGRNGMGLALSGGGIRSATFCLGVVQVLAARKLLPQFDYLSTVSGGGYLGAFMSNQFPPQTDQQKSAFNGSSMDSAQVRHLRNNSKYLLPTTGLSRLVLAGLLFSGILTTTLLTIAIPVVAGLITHFLARIGLFDGQRFGSLFGISWIRLDPVARTAVVFAALAAALLLVRAITPIWRVGRNLIDNTAACLCAGAVLLGVISATPFVLGLLDGNWLGEHWQIGGLSLAGAAAAGSGALALKAVGYVWRFRQWLTKLVIFSGAVLFAIVYLITVQRLGYAPLEGLLTTPEKAVLILLGIWAIWACAVNINLTGLHRYYRDGLASCYLQKTPPRTDIANPPPLEELSADLPYHLINTTVNLPASRNSELRGRGGDFFLMSKAFCGSPLVGYQRTEDVHKLNRDLDLATAMAISGAAASTNMGWQTMHQYRTLMAIFNVRLGYWLRWRSHTASWISSSAFVQLIREMQGWMKEDASTLNVSDGGHIENLAVYELIRRKLKYIVCVDGGMDGTMTCSDLNRLQRLVAIDFGYRIEFDTADLQLADGFSTNYGALIRIDYTPDEPDPAKKQLGWMLYLKLALLGTESNYVLDYRRENPQFPHQTTLDQFFDEAQFEAYRKLGQSAAENFFSDEFDTASVRRIDAWFQALAGYLLRDTDAVYSKALTL